MTHHLRRQIRDAAVAALIGQNPVFDVYPSRRIPLSPDKLPAWCVYTISEDASLETIGPNAHIERSLELACEGIVQAPAAETFRLDDVLDDMAILCESRLSADPTLGGIARYLVLQSTRIGLQGSVNGDVPTGSIVLTFRVIYRTRMTDPTTIN